MGGVKFTPPIRNRVKVPEFMFKEDLLYSAVFASL